jgi:hypothetical protein
VGEEPGSQEQGEEKKFLGLPYDWRPPTAERARSRLWNPDDPRLFPPKTFGWGQTINFYWFAHPRRWRARRRQPPTP